MRLALSGGLFRGKSKQLYDYLYSKTRGAVVPSVSAQLSRAEIMRGAHIGSTHTLRDNLRHLRDVGLVTWTEQPGQQDGNTYFVYLPEEIELPIDAQGNPVQLNCPDHPDHSAQDLPRPLSAGSALPAQGQTSDVTGTSGAPKTFSKDVSEKDDDEAFAGLNDLLRTLSREVTGSEPTSAEAERWKELGELLAAELRTAAGRTSVVSSAPALLVEHLRRRLSKPQIAPTPRPAASPEAGDPAPPPAPPTEEELVETFVNVLHGGITLEDLEAQFTASVDPERWPAIKQAVVERYERERRHVTTTWPRPDRSEDTGQGSADEKAEG